MTSFVRNDGSTRFRRNDEIPKKLTTYWRNWREKMTNFSRNDDFIWSSFLLNDYFFVVSSKTRSSFLKNVLNLKKVVIFALYKLILGSTGYVINKRIGVECKRIHNIHDRSRGLFSITSSSNLLIFLLKK